MSFYRSFASKDALVVDIFANRTGVLGLVGHRRGSISRRSPPPIEALFEAQLEIAMTNSCRGCALGNAAAEISDDEDELSTLVRAYKEKVRKRLHDMAGAMGARDPARLGDALMLLLDGGYFTRLIFPLGSGPIPRLCPLCAHSSTRTCPWAFLRTASPLPRGSWQPESNARVPARRLDHASLKILCPGRDSRRSNPAIPMARSTSS